MGSFYKIQDYLEAFGVSSWVPDFMILVGGITLSALEFVIGVLLLFGIRKGPATSLVLLFMLFMTPLTLYLAIADPVEDCGCFGDVWVLTNWQTFWKNVVLLAAAIVIYKWKDHIFSFVSEKSEWLISLYSIIFIVVLSLFCLRYLPILDFRPYKIGSNIPKEMSMPEGAKPSIYETVFILEKEGKKQQFTLENYPDSTWNFVDAKTVLKQRGYEPAIRDFSIIEQETGEDITQEVLSNKNYTFLLIAHRLEVASDSNIDLINEIYDYSIEHEYAFFCLTASPDYQIEEWRDRSGAEYPFGLVDDITLKTIVRSNPGLVLIKEGTILNKWSNNNLPDEYDLDNALEYIPLGKQKETSDGRTIAYSFLWFVLPLLFVSGLDILLVKRERRILKRLAEKKKKEEELN